jgi:2-polyprenyl-6-methoxyphenol hydroxylase-like FAD-dependent oxidoreductase
MYDAIIVGGGLAGASLAKSLAEARKRILVLEREISFKDRVRGEFICPWGVSEARRLGIYRLLLDTCAREEAFLHFRLAGAPPQPSRDLLATSPHKAGSLHFQHRDMQDALLTSAQEAGANIQRGIAITGVRGGVRPQVTFADHEGRKESASARLLVGADGRNSIIRAQCGFVINRGPDKMVIAGVLLNGMRAPQDGGTIIQNLATSQFAGIVPLRDGLFRCYHAHHKRASMGSMRLSGHKDFQHFIEASIETGAPADWFIGAEPIGPLASFDGADTWSDSFYRNGIVLVGDAAASSDPTHGCGLSLALRSVRILRDYLLENEDWRLAACQYAAKQAQDAEALRTITDWLTALWYDPGEEANQIRARALPLLAQDPSRVPDFIGLGPDSRHDEVARSRLFGEV